MAQAEGRRPVRRLRDEPDAAGAAGDRARTPPNTAPTNFPRTDLVTTFLTGIPGVNQPANVVASEELRLNTSIAPVPFAQQNRLGIVGSVLSGGSDFAGFDSRRPKDTTWSTSRWWR